MPRYTMSIPMTFAFDVDAYTESAAIEKAKKVVLQAHASDGWISRDVDAMFPRVQILDTFNTFANLTVEDVYDAD